MTDIGELLGPAPADRRATDLPLTLRPVDDPRVAQPAVFDPALKQYGDAYRAGEPRFADPALGQAWATARRRAMDLLLAAIADSAWVDHLVLRGSVLLRAWFGAAAREPGDLDFVVVPRNWKVGEDRTRELLSGVARAAEAASAAGPVRFTATEAVCEEIWTYERVPGLRLVLPWRAEGVPGGAVQLDFVFEEHLPTDPEPVELPSLDGSSALLLAATPELSLAWKLMWLISDCYPQGKDLYDAVLLAESTLLRYRVLRDTFATNEDYAHEPPIGLAAVRELADGVSYDWRYFTSEYPALATDVGSLVERLATALEPTFAQAPRDPVELTVWWRSAWPRPRRQRR
jgi:hypothetical protein